MKCQLNKVYFQWENKAKHLNTENCSRIHFKMETNYKKKRLKMHLSLYCFIHNSNAHVLLKIEGMCLLAVSINKMYTENKKRNKGKEAEKRRKTPFESDLNWFSRTIQNSTLTMVVSNKLILDVCLSDMDLTTRLQETRLFELCESWSSFFCVIKNRRTILQLISKQNLKLIFRHVLLSS